MSSHPSTSVLTIARRGAAALGLLVAGFVVVSSSRTAFPPPTPARLASIAVDDHATVAEAEPVPRIGSRAVADPDGGR